MNQGSIVCETADAYLRKTSLTEEFGPILNFYDIVIVFEGHVTVKVFSFERQVCFYFFIYYYSNTPNNRLQTFINVGNFLSQDGFLS